MSYRGRQKVSYGIRRLQRIHARRSSRARKVDESLKAPLAKSPEQWLAQPNRFDVLGVDTLKQSAKQEEKRQENAMAFETKPLSHSQIRQRLAMHKLYGETH